jgi:3'-phosphoadenosine 5'-phosphosulfate sulfotransferase (PAPS reductase)/FAD synthetase
LGHRSRNRQGQPARTWTPEDIDGYVGDAASHSIRSATRLPSIGCWPYARPVADGDDPRGGRWAGSRQGFSAASTAGRASQPVERPRSRGHRVRHRG